jgi:hypothetical protein
MRFHVPITQPEDNCPVYHVMRKEAADEQLRTI